MRFVLTRKRRLAAFVAAAAVIAVGGGISFAYWTADGTGTGAATTGTSTGFTVAGGTPTGGPLAPGGGAESVPFTVTNPGAGEQLLSAVTATIANADGSAWTAVPGCSADDYTVATPVVGFGEIVAGGTSDGAVSVSMNDTGLNQDACQGVSVPLYFVAS
ncbi:hypothetical protein [uncultured Jatrophihabitans sp.]|uniref:hypothetical protein n=1 Tax=uncultured Jatrophihabitans sp. TaxID=1610747 RepID=UPI0035CC41E0